MQKKISSKFFSKFIIVPLPQWCAMQHTTEPVRTPGRRKWTINDDDDGHVAHQRIIWDFLAAFQYLPTLTEVNHTNGMLKSRSCSHSIGHTFVALITGSAVFKL